MYADVHSVRVISHGKLAVNFHDGTQGTVEILPSFYRGVFSHLANPEEFNKVSAENGYVTWPGELDLASDAMYHAIVEHGSFIIQ